MRCSKNWDFPKQAKRFNGFQIWLEGILNYSYEEGGTIIKHAIKPFRLFDPKLLPLNIRKTYKVSWHPLFNLMTKEIDLSTIDVINAQKVNERYDKGTRT